MCPCHCRRLAFVNLSLEDVGVGDLQVHEQVATGAVDVTTMALKKYQYYFKFS